jgi:hypothetical protein
MDLHKKTEEIIRQMNGCIMYHSSHKQTTESSKMVVTHTEGVLSETFLFPLKPT